MIKLNVQQLHRLNTGLTIVAVSLGLYLIVSPFWPAVWWWAGHFSRHQNPAVVQVIKGSPAVAATSIPDGYWLDIPRIMLHQKIYTGSSESEVNLGVWHIWGTSTPDAGSNTVVAGHRFTYTNPSGVFYLLDKLEINDRVTVDWNMTEYTYKVTDVQVVSADDVAINNPTKDARFTLYTCTPVWSAKDRLVVTASLVAKRTAP